MNDKFIIDIPPLGDERGCLISLEYGKNLPFEIKRVYYIFNTKEGISRGFHAHRKLQQLAICVSGSCKFIIDDGYTRVDYILDKPGRALLINNMKWREMHDFSSDCVLLVLASDVYLESDYIRDYSDFLKEVTSVKIQNN